MDIHVSEEWLPVFEALASRVRLQIIQALAEQPMNIRELAERLGLSSAIMTMHVRKLETAGIIRTEMIPSRGGIQKRCILNVDTIRISFPNSAEEAREYYRVDVPVGYYTDFDVQPTCGLASVEKIIGQFDDPRYFSDPERVRANILWFGQGYIEYKFPNHMLPSQVLEEIEISLEIGSEAPKANENWPSDITFYLNGVRLGTWTSPGDFADRRGTYTPAWWPDEINQYGLLKVLRINREGSFIDGIQLSSVTVDDLPLGLHWTLRLSVEEDAQHVGGLTIYGAGFGNYNQDIVFKAYYSQKSVRQTHQSGIVIASS
ncbi:transcriptional regulator [Alicyclobacillus cellulosilyticus]|uniref:Transcriptional regulator n=1 Tax=Alicyclobacillus cellulosilyticus TaxID=1003997 RepID=A0A917NIT5_9BACL|nr:ArsR family transcriptional regulator [Alicyclobacillus cellulosilyticus]GGJ03803.1 transcriptional regulator [Alicyclobacillus cellulosilyticus]